MSSELFIGLMSGTSVDGVDAVLVDFSAATALIRGSLQLAFPAELASAIHHVSSCQQLSFAELALLENQLAQLYAQAVKQLLQQLNLAATQIRAIGNHGQTVRHHIQAELQFSVQLGNNHLLAELTGIAVVADFRRRDIAAGGQGAPLVGAFHRQLFAKAQHLRAVVNIGGICNLSLLIGSRLALAFDVGAGNTLLDAICREYFAINYDRDGLIASGASVQPQLLQAMLATEFLQLAPPKSTGRELFNLTWLQQLQQQFAPNCSPADLLATASEFSACALAQALAAQLQAQRDYGKIEIILCGGGVYNLDLIKRLERNMLTLLSFAEFSIATSADYGMAPQLVEASAFAWLARQTINGECNNSPQISGARGARILGAIYAHTPA